MYTRRNGKIIRGDEVFNQTMQDTVKKSRNSKIWIYTVVILVILLILGLVFFKRPTVKKDSFGIRIYR